MNTVEFLRSLWPAEGVYAIATPFTPPGETKPIYAHKTFASIEDAAAFVAKQRLSKDIFFAVHTLKEPKVWNPAKVDRRTGELGAFEVRVQSNMAAARCFFFDLDVGDKADKYPTQAAAVSDLIRFCKETGLPKPTLTSSGGGVHVYWTLTEEIASDDWRQHAAKLRAIARHHGLLADPSRTTDTASVLRVAGTFNLKDRNNPRKVRVLIEGKTTPTGVFLKKLQDEVTSSGLTVRDLPTAHVQDASGLGSNLDGDDFDGPQVGMKALITTCNQVRDYLRAKGNVSEPFWYHMLNLVRFTEDGSKNAHKVSAGHPGYNFDDTEKKIAQLQGKNVKPTTCYKLAEVNGDRPCEGCAFAGRVKNPLMAARFKDPAPRPIVQKVVGAHTLTTTVPDAPAPFERLKDGRIARIATNKEGDEIHMVILGHDLYPLRRVRNGERKSEQQIWRTDLPRQGAHEFMLDADALYDRRKFVAAVSNEGLYPEPANVEHLQGYMVAYISKLQQEADAEAQCNHLGWLDEDKTQWIMPDKILMPDGSAKPAMLSEQAEASTETIHKKGTLERQVELLRFYNDPGYVASQFFVMASLGAPLFFATGQHGVVLNATGETGASKSTTLYTGASLWGVPNLYAINGTNSGATTRARNERVSVLANLPVMVDEITNLPSKEAVDLAMGVTQPGHRIRLDNKGVERKKKGGYKATIMLTTANSSLHNLLSQDNASGTAGSMRVFEVFFKKLGLHAKPDADRYLAELQENYGHVGDAFMAYIVTHRDAVVERVRTEMARIDTECRIEGGERFWSATMAAALVAGRIAFELGLLPYDVELVRHWLVKKQLAYMRNTVVDNYVTPLGQIMDYLETINSKMVILGAPFQNNDIPNVLQKPHGELLAHFDTGSKTMWVLKKGFRDYCAKSGANSHKIMLDLTEQGVISNPSIKKVLGSGTEYAKGQTWCFILDMSHADVADKHALIPAKKEAPGLRVVEGGKV